MQDGSYAPRFSRYVGYGVQRSHGGYDHVSLLRSFSGNFSVLKSFRYGPDEFHTLGTMKDWTVIDDIPKINVPTLLINGRDDTAQDKVMLPFFNSISKVKWAQFAAASHTAHLEERDRVMEVVGSFLLNE